MIENTYDELQVGDRGIFEKTVTEADVSNYAGVTGDFSWLHVHKERAEKGHFKQRIAHGMLLAGYVSNIVGNIMPGAGTIYNTQNFIFLKPCFIGDTIKSVVEIAEKMSKGRVKLITRCYNQHGELILDGDAIVIPPREHFFDND